MNAYRTIMALSVLALLSGCDLQRKFDETQKTTDEMNETTKKMHKNNDDLAAGLRASYAAEARLNNLSAMMEEPGDSLATKIEYATKFTYAFEFQSPKNFDSLHRIIQMRSDGMREYLNQSKKFLSIRNKAKKEVTIVAQQIGEKKASLEQTSDPASQTIIEQEISVLSEKMTSAMVNFNEAQNNVRALAITMHLIKRDQYEYDSSRGDSNFILSPEGRFQSILSMIISGLGGANETNQTGVSSPSLPDLVVPQAVVQANIKTAKQMVIERMDALLLVTLSKISALETQTDPQGYLKGLNEQLWESSFAHPEFHVAEQMEVLKYLSGYVQLREECAEKKIDVVPTEESLAYIGALLQITVPDENSEPSQARRDNITAFGSLITKLK